MCVVQYGCTLNEADTRSVSLDPLGVAQVPIAPPTVDCFPAVVV